MTKCDKCSKQSKFFLAYGPINLCENHFNSFFQKRFKKTLRKYQMLKKNEVIVAGISGGKDSMVLLHLLEKFYSREQKIKALLIDEGIPNYRDKALKVAAKTLEEKGIEFKVISFKERLGKEMTEVMKKTGRKKKLGSTCSFCGPFRRKLLNDGAMEMHATKLATGHNLDDEIQSITMNFFDNDLKRMSMLGAISLGGKKLVSRIKPLYLSPEKEIIAYANLNEINHFSEQCCPFSWQAKRNEFRSMLNQMELKFPGTHYSILSFFENLKPFIPKQEKGMACEVCGSFSSKKICSPCIKLSAIV
ncbi:TIGR00269 family protein [Candidatus Micrarchaeota archaeon]|nr:TIGR00269 family protein [Candidatus Micrarchaeota archaeon]